MIQKFKTTANKIKKKNIYESKILFPIVGDKDLTTINTSGKQISSLQCNAINRHSFKGRVLSQSKRAQSFQGSNYHQNQIQNVNKQFKVKKSFDASRSRSKVLSKCRSQSITASPIFSKHLEQSLQRKCKEASQMVIPKYQKQLSKKKKRQNYQFKQLDHNLFLIQDFDQKPYTEQKTVLVRESEFSSNLKSSTFQNQSSLYDVQIKKIQTKQSQNEINNKIYLHETSFPKEKIVYESIGSQLGINLQKGKKAEKSVNMSLQNSPRDIESNFFLKDCIVSDLIVQNVFKIDKLENIQSKLSSLKITFISSKFSLKTDNQSLFFNIKKILLKRIDQRSFQILVFLSIFGHVIFLRILKPNSINCTSKYNEAKNKKHSHKRSKVLKEKVFNQIINFVEGNMTEFIHTHFLEDLIKFIENQYLLQKNFKGLILSGKEEKTMSSNKEHLFEILNVSRIFYFLLKINPTFYLVKMTLKPSLKISFIILCEFTTNSKGQQLLYSFNVQQIENLVQEFSKLKGEKMMANLQNKFIQYFQNEEMHQKGNKKLLSKEIHQQNFKLTIVERDIFNFYKVKRTQNLVKYQQFDMCHSFEFGFASSKSILFQVKDFFFLIEPINKIIILRHRKYFSINLKPEQFKNFLQLYNQHKNMKFCFNKEVNFGSYLQKMLQIQKLKTKNESLFCINNKQYKVTFSGINKNFNIFIYNIQSFKANKISFKPKDNSVKIQDLKEILKQYENKKTFIYSKYMKKEQRETKTIIYRKIHKIDHHFAYIVLYNISINNSIQMKVYMHKMQKEFVLKLDYPSQFKRIGPLEVIQDTLGILKKFYFRNLLKDQSNILKYKMKEKVLETMLKYHNRKNINLLNDRLKKKNIYESKLKMKKMATLKSDLEDRILSENILSNLYVSQKGINYYYTIRFESNKQFRQRDIINESIEICVYQEKKLCHFRLLSNMGSLFTSFAKVKFNTEEQINTKMFFLFFKVIETNIIIIIEESHGKIQKIIERIRKMILKENQQKVSQKLREYKLTEEHFFEIQKQKIQKQFFNISIDLNLRKQSAKSIFLSLQVLDDISQHMTEQAFKPLEMQNLSISLPNQMVFYENHRQLYFFQVLQTKTQQVNKGIICSDNLQFDKKIIVFDIKENKKILIKEWDVKFIGTVSFKKFNKKMFQRLQRCLKLTF